MVAQAQHPQLRMAGEGAHLHLLVSAQLEGSDDNQAQDFRVVADPEVLAAIAPELDQYQVSFLGRCDEIPQSDAALRLRDQIGSGNPDALVVILRFQDGSELPLSLLPAIVRRHTPTNPLRWGQAPVT